MIGGALRAATVTIAILKRLAEFNDALNDNKINDKNTIDYNLLHKLLDVFCKSR